MANSPARSAVDVGSIIADTYTIEALIGRGGMGSVFLASHTRLPGKRVAIKLLHVELTDDDVIARFRREALIASELDHPNIVRVDDYNVTDDGTPYLILEYLEGESLAQRIEKGPMPLAQVLSIMRMVGSAIAAAHHAGIVHRDLKPQNIFLITTDIDGQLVEVAKVLDFGISKMRGRDTVKTQESTLLGTPQYMAPEQATGNHAAVDERTDVFALGAIVYEMLSGGPAFSGENIPAVVFRVVYDQPEPLAAVVPDLPPHIVAAVEKAMAKHADERFGSVSEFVEALTGRPLAQRSSMISLSPLDASARAVSSGANRASGDAFANTIDSGSVAKSATHRPPVRLASPHAETLASLDGERHVAQLEAPRRPLGLTIALAVGLAAALGAAVYFAMRDGGPAAPAQVPADAAVATITADADEPIVIPELHDAAIPVAVVDATPLSEPPDAATVDARVKPTRPAVPARPARPDDPEIAKILTRAEAAYRAGNYALAEALANDVTNKKIASALQEARALVVRGAIQCTQYNNISRWKADWRAIEVPSQAARLKKICDDDAAGKQ